MDFAFDVMRQGGDGVLAGIIGNLIKQLPVVEESKGNHPSARPTKRRKQTSVEGKADALGKNATEFSEDA